MQTSVIVSSLGSQKYLDGMLEKGWRVVHSCPMPSSMGGVAPTCLVIIEEPNDAVKALFTEVERLRAIVNETHNWIVCSAITTPDDMAQNFGRIAEITDPDYKGGE